MKVGSRLGEPSSGVLPALSDRPVFVCGTGRSGTSTLFKLVAEQRGFTSFGSLECKFLVGGGGLIDLYRAFCTDFDFERAQRATATFRHVMKERLAVGGQYGADGLDAYLPPGHYEAEIERYMSVLVGSVPRYVEEDEFFQATRLFLDALVLPLSESRSDRWVEKTPHSILHIWFLRRLYPFAQFLHVTRDPRAVALSLLAQPWAPNSTEGCFEWLDQVYRRMFDELPTIESDGSRYRHLRFEDFLLSPREVAQSVGEFVGLSDVEPLSFRPLPEKVLGWSRSMSSGDDRLAVERFGPVMDHFSYPRPLRWWQEQFDALK